MAFESIQTSTVSESSAPGKKFKKLVVKAFQKEGVKSFDDIHECMKFAMGDLYPYIPYHQWGDEIWKRHKKDLTNLKLEDYRIVPAYIILRAIARLWRQKTKIFVLGGIG